MIKMHKLPVMVTVYAFCESYFYAKKIIFMKFYELQEDTWH